MASVELEEKLSRVRSYMSENNFQGVLFSTVANFAWISCGKSAFVDKSSEAAVAQVLITQEKQYVFCCSSEMFRIMDEELSPEDFELVSYMWHENAGEIIPKYIETSRCASDTGAYGTVKCEDLQVLRYVLTEGELKRYDEIGPECAGILEETCRGIRPGQDEYEIAGKITGDLMKKGYQVPVCLVAADERLLKYRHPLPKGHIVKKYAMIAICGQKYGLTVSISRIVCFGEVDEEIKKKYDALLKIDSTYILNTKAGVPSNEVLKKAYACYDAEGYEKDFHLHHQGGPLGYLTRDFCTNFENDTKVLDHQGYSWNPTIAGVKLEDTFIVRGDTQEIVTDTGKWAYRDVVIDGKAIRRPDILTIQI